MLTGRRWLARELEQRGLVNVCDGDATALGGAVARFVAEHLLTSSSRSVASMKRLAAHVSTHAHADNKRVAARAFVDAMASTDAVYGVSCFAQKSKPDWAAHLKANL